MDYNHDIDKASDVASEALERMRMEKIPPAPKNFEVWYVYYANIHPGLKAEINQMLQDEKQITESDCTKLYGKYLSEDRHQELYEIAGDQINSTLHDVSGLMENIKSATSEYGISLKSVNGKLTSIKTTKDLANIVGEITADTGRMLKHNKKLEEQLDLSSKAMKELRHDLERVRREAMTDGLTGLSNRKSFDEQIKRIIEESKKEEKIFTLLMVDIDHFKNFNDNFGHQVGDQVLRLVARVLTDGVKGRDIAARYGGEEFSIILPETNLNAGITVGESLRKAIATKDVINRTSGEHLGKITMSVGVAQYYGNESPEDLIERADAALYTAKHNGRNQVAAAPTPHEIGLTKTVKKEAG